VSEVAYLPRWGSVKTLISPVSHLFGKHYTDILCRRYDRVFVRPYPIDDESHGLMEGIGWESNEKLGALITALASALKQPIDPLTNPRLDGRMEDGSRVSGTLAPYVENHVLNIRLFPKVHYSGSDLVKFGVVPQKGLDFLAEKVCEGRTMVISGAVGCGKTTIMRVLSGFIPKGIAIGVAEDNAELNLSNHHIASYEIPVRRMRDMRGEKVDEMDLSKAIEWARRDLIERIVVGEIRTPSVAWAFIQSMMVGAKGSMTTLHADNPIQALENIALWATIHLGTDLYERLLELVYRLVDYVVQMENIDGVRRATAIYDVKAASFLKDGLLYQPELCKPQSPL
jgi:pilus assembly protein CpaF